MMLNEWSDREPDPPGRSGWWVVLAFILLGAAAVFLFNVALSIIAD
jgi:hypothetical protein